MLILPNSITHAIVHGIVCAVWRAQQETKQKNCRDCMHNCSTQHTSRQMIQSFVNATAKLPNSIKIISIEKSIHSPGSIQCPK